MKYEIWCNNQRGGSNTFDEFKMYETDLITEAISKAMSLFTSGDASTQIRRYKNENDYDCIQYVREIECQYKIQESGEVIELDTFYRRIDEADYELAAFLDDAIEYILDDNEEYDYEDIYCYWTENGIDRCYNAGLFWE